MTYAHLTDGLDQENLDKLNLILEGASGDKKTQARRERAAVAQLFGLGKVRKA